MTKEQFIQQLVIERFKFHLAHLTAALHTQEPANDEDIQDIDDSPSLSLENTASLVRAMNEDLILLERCLEQKV